jgi:hypothetical protein
VEAKQKLVVDAVALVTNVRIKEEQENNALGYVMEQDRAAVRSTAMFMMTEIYVSIVVAKSQIKVGAVVAPTVHVVVRPVAIVAIAVKTRKQRQRRA